MSNVTQLRLAAREIFEEALRAVDPAVALSQEVHLHPDHLQAFWHFNFSLNHDSRIFAVAIGKAALTMAAALESVLGETLTRGVIASSVFRSTDSQLRGRWSSFHGGHPLPNESSLAAAQATFALLDEANRTNTLVIFLVSGGGSASIEWPINTDISLEDLRAANRVLVSSGASINEVNSVRRAFSAIKGGRLSARALNCEQLTLIVSDVRPGEAYNVASGPTVLPPRGDFEAMEVVRRYDLENVLPRSILSAIQEFTPLPGLSEGEVGVLLDNYDSIKSAMKAASERGLFALSSEVVDGPIQTGCEDLLAQLAEMRELALGHGPCLVSGGEFACPVRGDGIGGRNLETALRIALQAEQNERVGEFVALCAGTDGIDGNSPAAGAIVDNTTIERARRIGLDPIDFLNRSDSYSFFVALGDAITTGPTGTNVRDLRILLRASD